MAAPAFAECRRARLLELPIPANIELPIGVSDFSRLAVAWGLSYPPSEIGEIVPPSAVEDKTPPPAARETRKLDFRGRSITSSAYRIRSLLTLDIGQ